MELTLETPLRYTCSTPYTGDDTFTYDSRTCKLGLSIPVYEYVWANIYVKFTRK